MASLKVLRSSSNRKEKNSEPKSLAFLDLLLLLDSKTMSLLAWLQDGKLEQEVSQTDLKNLFFKRKTFSKKVTSLDSIIVLLEILDTLELTTKNI